MSSRNIDGSPKDSAGPWLQANPNTQEETSQSHASSCWPHAFFVIKTSNMWVQQTLTNGKPFKCYINRSKDMKSVVCFLCSFAFNGHHPCLLSLLVRKRSSLFFRGYIISRSVYARPTSEKLLTTILSCSWNQINHYLVAHSISNGIIAHLQHLQLTHLRAEVPSKPPLSGRKPTRQDLDIRISTRKWQVCLALPGIVLRHYHAQSSHPQ